MADLLSRYVGSMLGLAVGDALGMPTETLSGEEIRKKFGVVKEYRKGNLPSGHYTDDTQQSLILAKSLLEDDGFDKERYVTRLVKETDPQRGLGPSLLSFLLRHGYLAMGTELNHNSKPAVPSNGLAMKIASVPLFLRQMPEKICGVIEDLGQITHPHPGSVAGAVAIAYSMRYALEVPQDQFDPERCLNSIVEQVEKYDPLMAKMLSRRTILKDKSSSSYSSVPNAVLQFLDAPLQYREGIISLINSGGDTDTKAAMFGAISGAYNGMEGIPPAWIDDLENGPQGREYIIFIAERLYHASKRQ